MKKLILLLFITLTTMACQEEQKIAFVDNAKVVNEYQKKKDFEEKFKAKIETFNKKADSMQQAIKLRHNCFNRALLK